jgi:hypothetical protein
MHQTKESSAVGTQVFVCVHMAELKMKLRLTTCVEYSVQLLTRLCIRMCIATEMS